VKYASADRFRTALEERLRQKAKEIGLPLLRLRKEVAFERLLARLLVVAPERWMLKGGLALDYRLGDRARSTQDMDLGHRESLDSATLDVMASAALDLGDYFVYTIERSDPLPIPEVGAVRYRVHVELAGRTFERAVVDIGLNTAATLGVERIRSRGLLAFAGLDSPLVPAFPLAFHIAEKVHAYTRTHGAGERESTRVKDLVDLVLIATDPSTQLSAAGVHDALVHTFSGRDAQVLPSFLPFPPASWPRPYRVLARDVGLDGDVVAGHRVAAALLDPILGGEPGMSLWVPAALVWSTED